MRAEDSAYYEAFTSRDPRFDGLFFIGVTSTKIYCRPVCPVKTPKQKNCRFFETAAAAEK
jgi:AraC family transcriptional regulator of adaptative response / DNA-3-methyladenine glycosylase II